MAPSHADPFRRWLVSPGSLTARIAERAGPVRVEVLAQRLARANRDEHRAIGMARVERPLVREVILHASGKALVLGHTIVDARAVRGAWRGLGALGSRPLAAMLYADPAVRRGTFEFARQDRRDPLWHRACAVARATLPPLRARRSVFRRRGVPLLVTEVFLPAIAAAGR